jgi:hypothetical protein
MLLIERFMTLQNHAAHHHPNVRNTSGCCFLPTISVEGIGIHSRAITPDLLTAESPTLIAVVPFDPPVPASFGIQGRIRVV